MTSTVCSWVESFPYTLKEVQNSNTIPCQQVSSEFDEQPNVIKLTRQLILTSWTKRFNFNGWQKRAKTLRQRQKNAHILLEASISAKEVRLQIIIEQFHRAATKDDSRKNKKDTARTDDLYKRSHIPYFGNVVPCIKNSFYICKVLYIENNLLQFTS